MPIMRRMNLINVHFTSLHDSGHALSYVCYTFIQRPKLRSLLWLRIKNLPVLALNRLGRHWGGHLRIDRSRS